MPSRDLKHAHPILQKAYISAKAEFETKFKDVTVFLTATYRSPEEQNELYAQGRTKPGKKVTNAKAGQSAHNYNPSFAIDVAFIKDGKVDWSEKNFKEFSKSMKNDSIEWGGTWKFLDLPHYEVKGWRNYIKK